MRQLQNKLTAMSSGGKTVLHRQQSMIGCSCWSGRRRASFRPCASCLAQPQEGRKALTSDSFSKNHCPALLRNIWFKHISHHNNHCLANLRYWSGFRNPRYGCDCGTETTPTALSFVRLTVMRRDQLEMNLKSAWSNV